MDKNSRSALILGTLIGVALFFSFVATNYALPSYDILFQSQLPTLRPTNNPNQIRSASGGRVDCGLVQSPSWLEIPMGFTSEWGAEFHCSAAVALKDWGTQTGMWDSQGFLIGIYPATVPLVKPVRWVQEVDPVRMKGICNQCLVGRYYRPLDKKWINLPTVYDADRGRVIVEIGEQRPASGYPGYEDRVLVALFQVDMTATVQMTVTSTRAVTATTIPTTSQATLTQQLTRLLPTPVPATKPSTPSPMVTSTPLKLTLSLATVSRINPTSTSTPSRPTFSPTMNRTTTSTPTSADSISSEISSNVTYILVGIIGLLSAAVIAMLILLIKKRPR